MKKTVLTALCFFLIATVVYADFDGPGSKAVDTTVAAVKDAPDDASVQLTGKILKKIKDEKYLFRDPTGAIVVEINDDVWKGAVVTPEMKVKLYGEVDNEIMEATTVEVEWIQVINKKDEKNKSSE
ncbi:MAG: NirD/YgiW/YdeI family stress tolerance protein [Victivallales bacterium]|nr:NirD/YgiW/YdeI family stress tolerance protein [Victivallales bacterium]MCF7889115.1 NirD/YgiW/YdeI family stress tolerance protein [Victivallales bacterium]